MSAAQKSIMVELVRPGVVRVGQFTDFLANFCKRPFII
jgi:hypothetical protein